MKIVKSNIKTYFAENPDENVVYPCGCGYLSDEYEARGGHCPSCGGDEIGTPANPKVTRLEAEESV